MNFGIELVGESVRLGNMGDMVFGDEDIGDIWLCIFFFRDDCW